MDENADDIVSQEEVNEDVYIQGYLRMKVNEELAAILEASADSDGMVTRTAVTRTDDVLTSIGATSLTRTFPYAGKFEARTRAAGLHLWYEVYFEPTESTVTRASKELTEVEGVVEVEYRPRVVSLHTGTMTPAGAVATAIDDASRSSDLPYNDPRLDEQWHYNNTGDGKNQVEGSDINLFAAWNSGVIGSNKVIVCVVDGGIDVDHQDLAANVWVNTAEANGTSGKDDDNNGYVDDVNGYNFVNKNATITGDDHGTHVAGTVAAVNNNGIGVCGVAGGDYSSDIQGVQLMSSQIFDGDDQTNNISNAIKYGADNGAVISQNSWGYDYTGSNVTNPSVPASDAAAIDYFIQYAGFDENGNQTGPMAGGLVVFAAGNEEVTYSIPGQYEPVMCVTSVRADYDSAYYTNYGDWADISATGGDYYRGSTSNQILSTTNGNTYAYYQGTSMAAPHVSGVAALIISKFGGTGFTPDDLKEIVYGTARDITSYNSFASKGWMGVGLIDAAACVIPVSTVAPDAISTFEFTPDWNVINASLVVPADTDSETGAPLAITAYYSQTPFDTTIDRSDLPSDIFSSSIFYVGDLAAGDTMEFTLGDLGFDETYYVALDSYDASRNYSELTKVMQVTTRENASPEVISQPSGILMEATGKTTSLNMASYFSDIDVADGDVLSYKSSSSASSVAVLASTGDVLYITSKGYGNATITLTATDFNGATAEVSFMIVVRDSSVEVDLYPNPVVDVLNVRMGAEYTTQIDIFNTSGGKVYSGSVDVSPFEAGQIDLSALSSGSYTLNLTYEGKELTRNIVKL